MDKWIKVEVIACVLALLYAVGKDIVVSIMNRRRRPKLTANKFKGEGMNWVPTVVTGLLLFLSIAMYTGHWPSGGWIMNWIPLLLCTLLIVVIIAIYKWPFNRRKKLPGPSESLTLTPYPLTLVSSPKHKPAKPGSSEYYRDKVIFVVRNSYDQTIEIWNPLWESKEVSIQAPLCTRLQKEVKDIWDKEELCITVSANGTFQGWIGLLQPPTGDGLEVRLSHQNTGYLLFPLKVGLKMRYARLKI